jgi:hypothetical protein
VSADSRGWFKVSEHTILSPVTAKALEESPPRYNDAKLDVNLVYFKLGSLSSSSSSPSSPSSIAGRAGASPDVAGGSGAVDIVSVAPSLIGVCSED